MQEETKQTKVFQVTGMTCGHCAMNVEKAFLSITGVENATVNLEQKNATVGFDSSKTNPEQIMEQIIHALDGTNYQASL